MSKSAPASLYMCSASVNFETREEKESIAEELEDGADKKDKDDLNEKGHVSNTSTLFSIICVVAGTGILAIAHALSRSGWIGLLFLFTSAVMSHYTGVLLIRCLYAIPGKRLTGYADIGYAAFGKPGSIIGFLFSQLMLFLTPTIYIMMASENLSQILMDYELVWFHRRTCVWMLCILVGIPFFCVRHMKDVSYLRQPTQTKVLMKSCDRHRYQHFAASMATVCFILIVCIISDMKKAPGTNHAVVVPQNLPMTFSTFSFSYCGHVIYPHLEQSMRMPKRWPQVLLVSTCTISLFYFTIGCIGYWVYGDQVESPIYASLPSNAAQHVAMLVMTLHALLTVPFYLYVFTLPFEGQRRQKWKRLMMRAAEMVGCGLVAILVPFRFSDLMNLVGTLVTDILTFVLPILFYIKLKPQLQWYDWMMCLLTVSMGIFCGAFGTLDAIQVMMSHVTH
ncbi:hypothetical protein BCV72DRAFT_306887 [Rhizopus microsporus var. microsporus]|uniref:Amino acid transporter transmembrane domain-containing protein n=2 Tax=Rhizopus microsporus TaxID=58291 RepID=A0A2G4T598_RHIZD|nr:uncharacterized protein RHIMIDRAFT_233781 [Rhizopus microsporus ATCC 52813]ORE04915.1 hypothetical protein BCV72DRAFT_306887 [Rhizopus microsporus var. microsporus]PHZ16179.1 hypothetical protein RHIMIDRAFT_233781 [Rhizopus microsporus ATCC 52813]